MTNILDTFKLSPLYEVFLPWLQKKQLRDWIKGGEKLPTPQLIKQLTVKHYASKYSITNFIETGTYLGSMIYASKDVFNKIYTIELDKRLYKRAKKKFSNFKHISVYPGDSSIVLPRILRRIQNPALFWLDAHYSDGITAKGSLTTPISKEIQSILKHKIKNHIILIDDASLFVGINHYPTIKQLKVDIFKKYPQAIIKTKNNIIQIILTPSTSKSS